MEPSSRRRRRWVVNLLALGVVILAAGAVWLRIELRWKGMGEQLGYLTAEVKARSPRRATFREPGIPGNAWEDYARGLDAYEAMRLAYPLDKLFDEREPVVVALEGDEVFRSANQKMLAHLVTGARRAEFRFPDDWMSGSRDLFLKTDRSWLIRIARLVRIESRLLVADGRSGETLELLTAAIQASVDFGRNVPVYEVDRTLQMSADLVQDLGDRLLKDPPSGEPLVSLDRLLESWDEAFTERYPLGIACALIREGRLYQERMPLAADRNDLFETGLKDFHSRDYLLSGAFFRALGWRGRAEEIFRSGSFYAEEEAWASLRKEVADTGRLLDQHRTIGWLCQGADPRRRQTHARIRMLRIAVRFRIDGAVLPLPDPWFGKGFVHERAGNRLRIWSADAADSVAVGKARWNRSDLRDVVLEIGR